MLIKTILLLGAGALLSACAITPPAAQPFNLVDAANEIHQGEFRPGDRSMVVRVGKRTYVGFYVIASNVAHSTDWGLGFGRYGRYGFQGAFPAERYTVISGNTGRAHLESSDGEHLNCEFMFEERRLIGECRSPQGKIYQLVARSAPGEVTR